MKRIALFLLHMSPIGRHNHGICSRHPEHFMFPFGFIRLLTRRRRIKRIRLISTNALPEYQRWGLGLVIPARLVPEVLEWGIE